jgi:transposase
MSIVGGLDIHRKQITFDYLDTVTGQVRRGQVTPADREHLWGLAGAVRRL